MKELITIDTSKIKALATDGEHFVMKPTAEQALLELRKYKDWINQVYDDVLDKIAEAGKEINPNFKGVKGEKASCVYRKYGSKYKYDWNKLSDIEPFIERKEWITVKSNEVEKYLKEVGELPEGIYEAPREAKLSLIIKGEESAEE